MSMQNEQPPLTAYSEEQRQAAVVKYKIIAPYLNKEKTLTAIIEETGIAGKRQKPRETRGRFNIGLWRE